MQRVRRAVFWTTAALGFAVFVVDAQLPSGVAVAIAYIPLIIVAAASAESQRYPLVAAGVATALTVAGAVWSPPTGEAWVAATNRVLLVVAFWTVAILLRWSDTAHRRVRELEEGRRVAERYRMHIESAPYGIYWVDARGHLLDANVATLRMLGYESTEELLAHGVERDLPALPDAGEGLPDRERTGRVPPTETLWKRRDGSLVLVRLSGRAVQDRDPGGERVYEIIAEDLTVQRSLQEQLLQAQRMETVGRLAGGVAHDFNNLLTVMTAETELALADTPPGAPAYDALVEIARAARRGAVLTGHLLTFSRRQVLQREALNLGEVVEAMDRMLRRLLSESVELITRFEPDVPPIVADRGQIEQVVMNLVVNARDAMPDGGSILIEVRSVSLDAAAATAVSDLSAGDYVLLAVSDTGAGMSPAVQRRLFEPFFTTKEIGKGTGLGLSTSASIVRSFAGRISVYSEEGIGTTMKVYLPAEHGARVSSRVGSAAALARGTEPILLVEDDRAVRDVTARALESLGYRVQEASCAAEARAIIRDPDAPISLLITDVVLPTVSGRVIAEEATAARPGLGVLFTSGYTEDAILHHKLVRAEATLLQKPFTIEALAHHVRAVLDAGRNARA